MKLKSQYKVEYWAYCHAESRCNDSSHKNYHQYGLRGIKFLFQSFEEFLKDIGPKPHKKLTLDRINNDGNYEIGNVRWATSDQQHNNKRRSTALKPELFIEYQGENLSIKEWSTKTGISRERIRLRYRSKWSIDEVLGFSPHIVKKIIKKPQNRLSTEEVKIIYAAKGTGNRRELATRFNVHPTVITFIWQQRNHKKITQNL